MGVQFPIHGAVRVAWKSSLVSFICETEEVVEDEEEKGHASSYEGEGA